MRRWLLALLAICACRKAKTEAAKPVPIEESPHELSDQEIGAIACAGRPKCELVRVLNAGSLLKVAELTLDAERAHDAEPPFTAETCVPYEHWLVRQKGRDVSRKLLLSTCNDGYGASGVGEDTFEVEPNVFRHVQSGGSASRWEHTSVLELSPMRLRSIGWWSGWSIASAFERGTFDFVDFKGHVRWYRPECPEGGGPPDMSDFGEISDSTDGPDVFVYDPIPIVAAPAGFDWKTTAVDACAPPFDGTSQGFVIHGARGEPADTGLRVLAIGPKTFVIEVIDDLPVTGSKSWLYDDHLEIWAEDEPADPADLCIPSKGSGGAGRLRQWAIRVSDGKLFPGYGAPTLAKDPMVVEHAGNRFKVELKMPVERVSVVFSDGDDGKSQERLVSTSRLVLGKAWTLGKTWEVPASEAACAVENGKLVRLLKRDFSGEKAALEDVP
jgi:hypothetical protein